jgi:predicted nucleic-acid-binding protein
VIGLDTNILVRFIAQDHPAQTAAATRLIDSLSPETPGYLSLVVIAELLWVLRFSYRFDKDEIERVVERLLRSRELMLEQEDVVAKALLQFRTTRSDFADCLIECGSRAAGCEQILTFDKRAVSTGMRLLATA